MQLYEVSDREHHTPLTAGEVAKLFREGQLNRGTRCKALAGKRWRTVDELFPLLKYDTGYASHDAEPRGTVDIPTRALLVTGLIGAVVIASCLLWVELRDRPSAVLAPFAAQKTRQAAVSGATSPGVARSSQAHAAATPRPVVPHHTNPAQIATQLGANRNAPPSQSSGSRVPAAAQITATRVANERRLLEERRRREQEQREQAIAVERLRARNEREAAEKQRGAWTDTIHPLNQYRPVLVGGSWVSVKIRDNDVTTFDAWVNGSFYNDVRKEKGISGSQKDETLIYSNGAASLYYVWELSGTLNRCRLRVRER